MTEATEFGSKASLDLDAAAERMAAQLNACAADWRDSVLGDAQFWLKRRYPALSDIDIAALGEAVKSRIKPGRRGRRGVLE